MLATVVEETGKYVWFHRICSMQCGMWFILKFIIIYVWQSVYVKGLFITYVAEHLNIFHSFRAKCNDFLLNFLTICVSFTFIYRFDFISNTNNNVSFCILKRIHFVLSIHLLWTFCFLFNFSPQLYPTICSLQITIIKTTPPKPTPRKLEHFQMKPSSYSVVAQITSPSQCVVVTSDPNGNHDSGYAPSNIEDAVAGTSTPPESPHQPLKAHTENGNSSKRNSLNKRNGIDESPKREPPPRYVNHHHHHHHHHRRNIVPLWRCSAILNTNLCGRFPIWNFEWYSDSTSKFTFYCIFSRFSLSLTITISFLLVHLLCYSVGGKAVANVRYGVQSSLTRNDSNISTNSRGSRKDKKNSQASRYVNNLQVINCPLLSVLLRIQPYILTAHCSHTTIHNTHTHYTHRMYSQ